MVDRIGQQLGNYRLTRLLGRGGFAEVYLGEHLRLNMQAAIKVIYTQLTDDETEKFYREAQIIASLIHPHIVRVLDFDVKDDIPFLVMDYMPNGSLRQKHPKRIPLPLPTIVSYVKQTADALQHAHDQRLIHRDVKPENMLLDRRNEVVLSDFGIAIIAHSSRSQDTQEIAGTAAYMAPEQFKGKPQLASDQYALGAVVYEWLSGSRLFQGSFSEIASQHLFVPPPSLREKIASIPPAIEEVVMIALAKNPKERFANVQAFAHAFERANQKEKPINTHFPLKLVSPFAPQTNTSEEASSIPQGVESPSDHPYLPPYPLTPSQSQTSEVSTNAPFSSIPQNISVLATSDSKEVVPASRIHPSHSSIPNQFSSVSSQSISINPRRKLSRFPMSLFTHPFQLAAIGFSSLLIVLLVLIGARQLFLQPIHVMPNNFVVRSGSQLLLKGEPFRFSGANIYWLGLDENVDGLDYPTRFRVDDALATAQEMGATVVRSHSLGISVGCPLCVEPAPGIFNELALQHVDYAIASAKKHGLKLIIPLVDNFHWYHGGKHTFTEWRGLTDEQQFYSNATVIGDFEHYISHILNRVNSMTGIAYKNDPTILGWETGNGLTAPAAWVQTIASYLKSIDPHHLVIDGNSGQSYATPNFTHDVSLSDVDVFTGQYYPLNTAELTKQAEQAHQANRVFIAEEYAWNNNGGGDSLAAFLKTIETTPAISGDLFWSLFGHNDTFGYVQHNDGYTLHYPGDTVDMQDRVMQLRDHAYAMRAMPVPLYRMYGEPLITATTPRLAWRGVAGAFWYTVERSTAGPDGPWLALCVKCTDNEAPWMDTSRPAGTAWYKIEASNLSETGVYSAIQEIQQLPAKKLSYRKARCCQM